MESVEKEFKNARLIWNMEFSKPKAYEIITYNKQIGIIYDKLKGESLLDWFMRTGNIGECAIYIWQSYINKSWKIRLMVYQITRIF